MKRTLWISCAAGLLLAVPARAADFEPAPVFDWSGFYVGLHAGFIGAEFNFDLGFPGPGGEAGSFIGGGQIGYNWQMDGFVLGAEADASFIDLDATGAAGEFHEDFMATARLRAGATFDRYLLYITGGIAGTDKSAKMTGSSSDSEFTLGLAAGAGVEAMFGENWSARVEYLYVNVPDDKLNSGGVTIVGGSDNHIVRAGFNWHF